MGGMPPGGKKTSAPQARALKILNDKPERKDIKTVAVIVSICNGGSYDSLFTTVEQKSIEGTKVEVFACDSLYLPSLTAAFEGKPADPIAVRLMEAVVQVDPDCVVINWECCGGYSSK